MSLEPRSEAGRRTLALLFFTALAAALFFPALVLGKLIYGYDTLVLGVPFHAEVLRCLDAGQWPLWMPDILGGMPGIASCNLTFSYPTAFVGCLARLDFPLLLSLDASINVLAAGMGMLLLLRRMKVSFPAALLGAFFFAVSGSELSQLNGGYFNLMEAVAWVPWVFWAAHKGIRERSLAGWGLCGAALALQILAGGTQLCFYTLAVLACFVWASTRRPDAPALENTNLKAALQGLGLALLTAFLLAAPQVWPTLRYLPFTSRPAWNRADLLQGAIRPSEALAWIVPGFFGWQTPCYHGGMKVLFSSEYLGLLPLCLAAGSLNALWKRDQRVRWLAVLSLTAFFFAQNRWTPFYALFQRLPVVSGFRIWSRILFLNTIAICILASLGFDALSERETRSAAMRGALCFLGLAAGLALTAWVLAPGEARSGLAQLFATGCPLTPAKVTALLTGLSRDSALRSLGLLAILAALLGLFLRRSRLAPSLVLALAVGFHCFDQFAMFTRFVRFMEPSAAAAPPAVYKEAPPRPPDLAPWRVEDADIFYPNNAALLGYENLLGRESMPMSGQQKLAQTLAGNPERYDDLMGVRFRFSHEGQSAGLGEQGNKVEIYENKEAYPRAWLTGKALSVTSAAQAFALLASPAFDPKREVAVPAGLDLSGAEPRGSVRWVERSPLAFGLDVDTDRATALVVSNFWYPAWKASVDGKETSVLKADGALQAVAVPQGRHQVDFYYDESLFNEALAACLAGLALLAGLFWMERKI